MVENELVARVRAGVVFKDGERANEKAAIKAMQKRWKVSA